MIIYRLLYRAFLSAIWLLKPFLSEKIRRTIELRKVPYILLRTPLKKKTIWVHYASGELEYAKPVLRDLKFKFPEVSIFATYFSPSVIQATEKTAELDGWCPLPWDRKNDLLAFIEKINPTLLLISRTDLWPEMLDICKSKEIPSLLMGATFAEGSKKTRGLGRWLTKLALQRIDEVLVVSPADFESAKSLTDPSKISVVGDPRYDQVLFRKTHKSPIDETLKTWAQKEPLLVAGSTWKEDEEILFKMINYYSPGVRLLLVPHETNEQHLSEIEFQLKELQLTYSRFSKGINPSAQVLVFDKIGYLADLYQLSPLAFVGGSFRKQIHSVMEALGHGCYVITGPYFKNNREAIEWSRVKTESNTPIVQTVNSAEEMGRKVKSLLSIGGPGSIQEIQSEFLRHTGSTQKIVERIEKWL